MIDETKKKRRSVPLRHRRAPYQSPPRREPRAHSANSQPESLRDPYSSAKAGMQISSTPSETAVIMSEATSVRRPGLDSAPTQEAPGSRGAGRQRREEGDAATPSAPAVCIAAAVSTAVAGESSVAIAAASSGPLMNTSSSWSASNAKAVSSRSRPTSPGSSVRSDAETGGIVAPPATASSASSTVPPPESAATTSAISATAASTAVGMSTRVCPTRSISRP